MALTKQFKQSVVERLQDDPDFAVALLREGVQALFDGEIEVGKSMIRDYINATVGFEAVASDIDKSPKSVMRMFSASGNPNTGNLFGVLASLQRRGCVNLEVSYRLY